MLFLGANLLFPQNLSPESIEKQNNPRYHSVKTFCGKDVNYQRPKIMKKPKTLEPLDALKEFICYSEIHNFKDRFSDNLMYKKGENFVIVENSSNNMGRIIPNELFARKDYPRYFMEKGITYHQNIDDVLKETGLYESEKDDLYNIHPIKDKIK
ncbi:MAG: hypothetical protein AABX88_02535 [Nanoarchaeota archaeon]